MKEALSNHTAVGQGSLGKGSLPKVREQHAVTMTKVELLTVIGSSGS